MASVPKPAVVTFGGRKTVAGENRLQAGLLRIASPSKGIRSLWRRPGFCVFVFFLLFYYFTNAGWYKTGDEHFMSLTAKEMAQNGRIGYRIAEPPRAGYFVRGPDGLCYSKWGLGQSLVEVPFYYLHGLLWGSAGSVRAPQGSPIPGSLSEVLVIFLCPSLISALGCWLLFRLGGRLGFTQGVSLLLALLYGLGTMVWPYSKSLMSEATLNVAVMGGVYGAVLYATDRGGGWLTLSGACMGFALITKAISLVIVPVLVVYVLVRVRSRLAVRDLILFFIPPLSAFLCLQFWHNWIRFGGLWQLGYDSGQDVLGFSTPLHVGLWGLFLSPGKSFFLYTPVAVLGVLCLWRFFQKRKEEALLFVAICAVYTLPHALYYGWSGDWAWGPRFLLIIVPYTILPAGVFLENLATGGRVRKILVAFLVFVSVSVQVLGVAVHPFSLILPRHEVIKQIVTVTPQNYATLVAGDEIASFVPRFSHILGNWWLLKHMIVSYDLWSDAPWMGLGVSSQSLPTTWIQGNRTIPFWWPVALPLISPSERTRVYLLAAANLLLVIFCGLRVAGLFRKDPEEGTGSRGGRKSSSIGNGPMPRPEGINEAQGSGRTAQGKTVEKIER